VFRLAKVNNERVLVYSPVLDIDHSSIPFRALLGAVLSVIEGFTVDATTFPTDAVLNTLPEEDDAEDPPDDDDDDESSEYKPSASGITFYDGPLTPSQSKATGYTLMVRFLSFLHPAHQQTDWI